MQGNSKPSGFNNLGIAPAILTLLQKHRFETPTPIQEKSIPVALQGTDVMGIAQTGTGKTMAFGIPMVQKLLQDQSQALVVLPTRELAIQVFENLEKIARPLGLGATVLIGGAPMDRQIMNLRRNPHIIIGTPGRLNDHLEQKTLNLSRVRTLVLDEADRMLDMGFAPQIKRLLVTVPKDRQTMLFSATMPDQIVQIARSYMKAPVRVEVAPAGTASKQITQEVFFVGKTLKNRLLEKILGEYKGAILVFSRTKHGAKKITRAVREMGHTAAELHSNKSLNQRREALEGFKNGKYRVLIATDIAARGIDVTGIELVVNYDLPDNSEDYVHRIGRTGRAGQKGHAISFANPDQGGDVRSIERLIRATLPVSRLPAELPPERAVPFVPRDFSPRRPFSPRPGGFRGARPSRPPGKPRFGSRRPSGPR